MLRKSQILAGVVQRGFSMLGNRSMSVYVAPMQKTALEEKCILVDEDDKPVGEASKGHVHRMDNNLPLHRAFSVFLFNENGELLLQKRSPTKIHFGGFYTNSCCSHPLAEISGEVDEKEAIGVRRAAQRRLGYELGIPELEVKPEEFTYMTRIHYRAPGDHYWGEHEIDYILFMQKDKYTVNPNSDEVSEITWVARKDIDEFVKTCGCPITPWFRLILDSKLRTWWDNLKSLQKYQDHKTIHRYL